MRDDQGGFDWIEWQTMDSCQDDTVALTMASATSQLFGVRRGGVWFEILDGDEIPKPGYTPTQWTSVPEEKWADWAM